MKFLTSLVSNSRQPARRPGRADAAAQAEPFNPAHPMQENLPPQPHRQPVNNTQRRHRDDASAADLSSPAPREESFGATESRVATSRNGEPGQRAADLPGMTEDIAGEPLTSVPPEVPSTSAHRPAAREMRKEAEGSPPLADSPAAPVSQTNREPAAMATYEPLAGQPQDLNPRASQILSRSGEVAVAPAQPSVPQRSAETELPGLPNGATAEASPDREQPDQPSATRPERRSQTEAEQPSHPSEPAQQAEQPVTPIQAELLQESSMPRDPFSRQSAHKTQTREIPQVRIGQINVLVEDQAPAKAKSKTSSPKPAAANPFGLRGL